MSGYLIFTCPACRAIVDYSCLCDTPRSINEFVGHDSVDDAKKHVESMRGATTAKEGAA